MSETAFAPLVDDTNLETMFGAKYEPSPAAAARQRIQQLDAGNSSTLTKVLAIGAALKGDARPLLQIEENKRKTAIGIGILPELSRIKEAQAGRRWEEAQALTEQLGLTVGAQAEHLVPLFQQLISKNTSEMEKQRQAEAVVNYFKSTPVGIDKNHPSNPMFKSLEKAVKDRSPFTDAIMSNIVSSMKLHVQNINNQQIMTSETTGGSAINTLPQVMSEKDINAYSGAQISGHYGISKAQIADVLNNASNDVEMKGQKIPLGHPLREQLKQDYYGLQSKEAQLQIAPLIPQEPGLVTQMQAMGATPEQIATRQTGNLAGPALEAEQGRFIRRAEAPEIAKINLDPFSAVKAGITYVDPKTGQRKPVMTYKDFLTKSGAVVPASQDEAQKVVEPVFHAREGLRYLPDMFKAYGQVDTPFSALGAVAQKEIGKRLGIPLSRNMTLGQAAELAVERALEEAENTKLIDDREVANLKALMTGRFASPVQAVETANMILQRLDDRLGRVLGPENVSSQRIPVESVIPGTPESQVPGKLPVQPAVPPAQNIKNKAYLKKLKVGD